jgi:hypothetical protein
MTIDQTTANRSYPKPHVANMLANDVERLRLALDAIDSDMVDRPTSTAVQALISAAIANVIAGAPGALDTLNELAAALGDDANFAGTVANSLASINTALGDRYTKVESDARYVQGSVQVETMFTATAGQVSFGLTSPIINKPSALITVDGVVQPTSEYSISQDGLTVTLSEAPGAGARVRVLALAVAAAGAPADDTVTTVKLRNEAVTAPKLAPGAVGAPAVSPDFITSGGDWAPAITSPVNCSDVSMVNGSYARVGNAVTMSGRIVYTTTGGGPVSFGLRIPINAEAGGFQTVNQAAGVISGTQGNNPLSGFIIAEASSQRAVFQFTSGSAGTGNVSFVCQYRIAAT